MKNKRSWKNMEQIIMTYFILNDPKITFFPKILRKKIVQIITLKRSCQIRPAKNGVSNLRSSINFFFKI